MRLVVALTLALVAGCGDDPPPLPPDLSSSTLYCPPSPPGDESYECDPTAIPYCTYPTQQVTCRCVAVDGRDVLVCPGGLGAGDCGGAGNSD